MVANKSLIDLINMTKVELDKVNKAVMIDAFMAVSDQDVGANVRIELQLMNLSSEFTNMRQEIAIRDKHLEDKVNDLSNSVVKLSEIVLKQQLFLENIDRKDRETRLVVLGVPEDNFDGVSTDNEKLDKVWSQIGETGSHLSCKRLGNNARPGRKRPILVTVRSKEARVIVLEKAKALKQANETYKSIYIKKDVHPEVRKEWNRLREAEKTEKKCSRNVGSVIRLDAKERKLYKDGVVIDQWRPHPF